MRRPWWWWLVGVLVFFFRCFFFFLFFSSSCVADDDHDDDRRRKILHIVNRLVHTKSSQPTPTTNRAPTNRDDRSSLIIINMRTCNMCDAIFDRHCSYPVPTGEWFTVVEDANVRMAYIKAECDQTERKKNASSGMRVRVSNVVSLVKS